MIDCMAPQKRIDLIESRFGCQKLGFDYIQGPLDPCSTPDEVADGVCEELLLYQYKAQNIPMLPPPIWNGLSSITTKRPTGKAIPAI